MAEKTITLTLTESQCNDIAFVCDAALKAQGIKVRSAMWLVQQMEIELKKVNDVIAPDLNPGASQP